MIAQTCLLVLAMLMVAMGIQPAAAMKSVADKRFGNNHLTLELQPNRQLCLTHQPH